MIFKKYKFITEWKPIEIVALNTDYAIKKFINLGLSVDDILAIETYK